MEHLSRQRGVPLAADAFAAVLDSEPIALDRAPALGLRRLARQPLGRLVARALIQLLLITMLPQEWQVRLVLWPAFAFLAAERAQERLTGSPLSAAISPLTEGPGGTLGKEPNRTGVQRIVDLTDAAHPVGLGYAELEPASPTDVVIRDDVAYVSYSDHVVMVSFTDPTQPRVTGRIEKIGGRIAFGENGSILFGTAYKPWGGDDPLGGVKTAALSELVYLRRVDPQPFRVENDTNIAPVVVEVGIVPTDHPIKTAELEILREGQVVSTLPLVNRRAVMAPGFPFNPDLLHETRAVINRGMTELELVSARRALRPVQLEFTETGEVEVETAGKRTIEDVAKVFDARPRVRIDTLQLEQGGERRVTIGGTVRDEIAPISEVWIGIKRFEVKQTSAGPEGRGPFEGSFFSNNGEVSHGKGDRLITVTATNSLSNTGWDSAWVRVNPDVAGNSGTPSVSALESVPPFEAAQAEMERHRFRLEVKDRGLGESPFVTVKLTTSEEKTVRLERQGNLYRSKWLYLVPETYVAPAGLAADLTRELRETRIKAAPGSKPKLTYVRDDVKDEAIAAGIVLVDDKDQPLRFVPGSVQQPIVTITEIAEVNYLARTAVVKGEVRDPVAQALAGAPAPHVSANGKDVEPIAVGEGLFRFGVTVPLPTMLTHVQVRAENVSGAWGTDGRYVTLVEDVSGGIVAHEVEGSQTSVIPSWKGVPFKLKVFGPKLGVQGLSATVKGVYSAPFGKAELSGETPPSVAVSFEQKTTATSGVYAYLSKEKLLGAKVPSHSWRLPKTPSTLGQAPLVAVEVGGLVDGRITLGAAGEIGTLVDVSGFEIASPADGAVVNVSQMIAGEEPSLEATIKSRGITGTPSLMLVRPGMMATADQPVVSGVPLTAGLTEGTAVSGFFSSGFEENVLVGTARDAAGNVFSSQAGIFGFTTGMVRNESPIGMEFRDPGALQLGPGRFHLPAVMDGLDLLYPDASDVEISDHLQKNGLRAIAMKRNGGTLVTVQRHDGRDAVEALSYEVPRGYPVPGAPPRPLLDEPVDGDDLLYRHIVEEGLENRWRGTYDRSLVMPPFDVYQRSDIIQRVRRKNGLPLSEDGRSVEYQQAIDAANWDLGVLAASTIFPYLLRPLGALFGLGRGFFVSAADGAILEIADAAAGAVQVNKVAVPAANRILPTLTRVSDYLLPYGSQEGGALATQYKSLQVLQRGHWANEALSATIADQLTGVSTELGVYGARSVAQQYLGIDLGTRICCDGADRGGGASGKFDEVYVQGDRIVIVEAKGGLGYRNPLAKKAGRKILVNGAEKFAFQGTREYLEEIVSIMRRSSDPQIALAGDTIFDKLQAEGLTKIDYYIVSTRWAGRTQRAVGKGLVAGVSRVVRIYRAVF